MHDTDLSTIENRLHALEKRITKTAAKSKTRTTLTIAAMACLLVGAFFYLRFLSTSITTAADAPTLVQLVADLLEPRLHHRMHKGPNRLTAAIRTDAIMRLRHFHAKRLRLWSPIYPLLFNLRELGPLVVVGFRKGVVVFEPCKETEQ